MKYNHTLKPHIKLVGGWWRVSAKPKPYWRYDKIWNRAYDFIRKLNKDRMDSLQYHSTNRFTH